MITVMDLNQRTLVHYAVLANNQAALHYLLEKHSFNLESTDSDGQTAIDIAESRNYDKITDYLTSYPENSIRENRMR